MRPHLRLRRTAAGHADHHLGRVDCNGSAQNAAGQLRRAKPVLQQKHRTPPAEPPGIGPERRGKIMGLGRDRQHAAGQGLGIRRAGLRNADRARRDAMPAEQARYREAVRHAAAAHQRRDLRPGQGKFAARQKPSRSAARHRNAIAGHRALQDRIRPSPHNPRWQSDPAKRKRRTRKQPGHRGRLTGRRLSRTGPCPGSALPEAGCPEETASAARAPAPGRSRPRRPAGGSRRRRAGRRTGRCSACRE